VRIFARAPRAVDNAPPENAPGGGSWSSVARTHVGRVRQINEDRLLNCPERGLWAVADGMGGHRGGDIAADIVISALREASERPETPLAHDIEAALHRANLRIREHALSAGGVIGSTVVVLYVTGERACLFWVGDSRGYRLRREGFEQLTRDHSLVQELVDAGAISPDAAATHPQANVVTRALGVEAELKIEKRLFPVAADDLLLLCSDGLSRSLGDDAMPARGETDDALADRLLQSALGRDGTDNITFVAVRFRACEPNATRTN